MPDVKRRGFPCPSRKDREKVSGLPLRTVIETHIKILPTPVPVVCSRDQSRMIVATHGVGSINMWWALRETLPIRKGRWWRHGLKSSHPSNISHPSITLIAVIGKEWKRPYFWWLVAQNRGQTGSRYMQRLFLRVFPPGRGDWR